MTHAAISLAGKRVVVIGGASGIGFAVAKLAQELGAEVVIASRNSARIDAAVERLPGATGDSIDLRDEVSIAHFFENLGGFDHLAITANDWGSAGSGATSDIDLAAARDSFEVRFWGALAAVKHASRNIASNGSITLTSGMLAHRPKKGALLTSTVIGAVEHLARGLAVDLAPVRVNTVCPGLTLTEHSKQMSDEVLHAAVAELPLQRGASPEEAAAAYIYSMLNAYVTGQTMPVDGGGALV